MVCVRSLPMRDRARAMRHARYVGPVGKGGSESFSLYGSAWFGSVWGGILLGGIARAGCGIFSPRESTSPVPGPPLNSRAELEKTLCPLCPFGASDGATGSLLGYLS